MSYSIPRDVYLLLEAAFNKDREKAGILIGITVFGLTLFNPAFVK